MRRRMQRVRLLVLLAVVAVVGVEAGSGEILTILHTNDMHARYLPRPATWLKVEPAPAIGGMVRLAALIDSLRTVHASTLTLDAGDVMTGNPIADRPFEGAQGGLLIEMMNRIGYDAWSPGNHEFDISQDNLRALMRLARFPSLSANLADSAGNQYPGTVPSIVLRKGSLRIGIIGIMSQRLSSLVLQRNLEGVRVLDPAATARRLIAELDPVTDLVIALTHQGFDADSLLAEEVSGLDVIVGGHSHTRIREPREVNGVLIVQAGSYCENLGMLTIRVEDDRVVEHTGRLIPLWVAAQPAAGSLEPFVDSIRAVIDREYSEVLTTIDEPWRRFAPDLRLATAITEAQREAAQVDIAFMNRGGIRRDLDAGPVTRNDLYETLPFRNMLGVFQLRGSQLREMVDHLSRRDGDVIVTGITVEWNRTGGDVVAVERIVVDGSELQDDRLYRCSASDYFLGQFRRYCGVEAPTAHFGTLTVFEAVEEAFRDRGLGDRMLPVGFTGRPDADRALSAPAPY